MTSFTYGIKEKRTLAILVSALFPSFLPDELIKTLNKRKNQSLKYPNNLHLKSSFREDQANWENIQNDTQDGWNKTEKLILALKRIVSKFSYLSNLWSSTFIFKEQNKNIPLSYHAGFF